MKIYSNLLVSCVFYPNVGGATAFSFHSQKVKALTGLTCQTTRSFSPLHAQRGSSSEISSSSSSRAARIKKTAGSKDLRGAPFWADAGQIARKQRDKDDRWDTSSPDLVQGGSLRTWSFASPTVERVQVLLKSQGRPINANVELWQGPDNTPQKMAVYCEDGSVRPFSSVIESPRGSNTVSIRNTASLEYPLAAFVEPDDDSGRLESASQNLFEKTPRTVQGGAVHTVPFQPAVESMQILLMTDGRPLNARVELLQGPNNIKQVIELYTEDGLDRPFYAVFNSPGTGNVVRIVNTATMEYPLTARVEPYEVNTEKGTGAGSYGGFVSSR